MDVVPLAQRQTYLQGFRALTLVVVALIAGLAPHALVVDRPALLAAAGAYVGLSLVTQLAGRAGERAGVRAFGLMLIADGAFLGWAAYATGGAASPVRYLMVIHLIAVALLASYRTGLKLALWHSLLLVVAFHLQEAGILRPASADGVGIGVGTPFQRMIEFAAFFWVATIGTAAASAVNERELRRRRFDLEALARMAERLEHAAGPAEVGAALLDATCETFNFRRGVLLAAREGEAPAPLAARGTAPAGAMPADPSPDSVVARVAAGRRTRLLAALDPAADPWLAAALPEAGNLVVAPLVAERSVVGVLVAEHGGRMGARIQRRVVTTVERFASHGALALANAWLLEHVRRSASTDGLTGAANRAAFDAALRRELARSERHGEELALLLIDIDHFKRVNDTHGHQTGDVVLKRTSALLLGAARESDLVARYGGEEFAVVLPHTGLDDALAAAERLRAAVEAAQGEPAVTVSIGVAVSPGHAHDADSLVAEADAALYRSKADGRNRVSAAGTGALAARPSPRTP